MAEPPPRVPPEPDDETVVVPPTDETGVADDWGPESEVFVEETETTPPRRRMPVLWPWLLALLLLVLAGLAAAYFLTRDDDDNAAATTATSPTTTATTAPTTTTVATVSVPDVVGTTSSEATKTLRDAGFDVNVVPVPSDRPSGQVVAQSPAAGADADEGSTIRLNVAQKAAQTTTAATTATTDTSTAPTATTPPTEPATVPDAVGKELADAAREFNAEGLKVAVAYVPSEEPRGRVVAQAQPAGTERKQGDTVQLNVSTGPNPPEQTAVPDVAGTRQNPARRQLAAAGFEVLALQQQTTDRSRVGFVLSQTPSGGASIARGSLVLLYVGS
jgi:beta-lactam-binding protein with PASTA domain